MRLFLSLLLVALVTGPRPAAGEEEHRATFLGNPSTRFAAPLSTPEDLRRTLGSDALRADVELIARLSGFQGPMSDLLAAAASAPIVELEIPVGNRMPAMSTRRGGKPVLLKNVVWAGKAPIQAYEMLFTSAGRRYRLVCPKPCSNFWIEDKGLEPKPVLTLDCDAPAEVPLRRPANVCFKVTNTGDAMEPATVLVLSIPAGATLASQPEGASLRGGAIYWEIVDIAPGDTVRRCVSLTLPAPGILPVASRVQGSIAPRVDRNCETRVVGVPAVLLEVIDLVDPIEVGQEETYEIRVLNQGSVGLTHVRLTCTLEETQAFVSGTGSSPMTAEGREITLDPVARLEPGATANWRLSIRTLSAGDVRFTTRLTSDQIREPVRETESTRQY